MSEVAPRYVFCQKNAIQSGRTQNKFYYSARFGILLTHGHPPSPAIARGAVPAGGGGGRYVRQWARVNLKAPHPYISSEKATKMRQK